MIVEHISLLTGNSVSRDTSDIYAETISYFKRLKPTGKIEGTRMQLRIIEHPLISVFDLTIGNAIVTSNVCCYNNEGREIALNHVRSLTRLHPTLAKVFHSMKVPKTDNFLITIPLNVFDASPHELRIAGEVEFYIYEMLRK